MRLLLLIMVFSLPFSGAVRFPQSTHPEQYMSPPCLFRKLLHFSTSHSIGFSPQINMTCPDAPFLGLGCATYHVFAHLWRTYLSNRTASMGVICIWSASQYKSAYPESGDPIYACAIWRCSDPGRAMHAAVVLSVLRTRPCSSLC